MYTNGKCHLVLNSSGAYAAELNAHNNLNSNSRPNQEDYEDGFPISSGRNTATIFDYPIQEHVNEDYFPPFQPQRPTSVDFVLPESQAIIQHQLNLNLPVTVSFMPENNDFNAVYIRDKLLHDSQIPESCV